jgi:hypothetical protein
MAMMNDDIDVPRIAVIGVCATISVYVFIVLTRVVFMQLEEEEQQKKVIDTHPRSLSQYASEQEQKLGGGYRWSDEKSHQVHLPIDVAMAKVTQELASSHKLEPFGRPNPEPPRETTVIGVPTQAPQTATPKKAPARQLPHP